MTDARAMLTERMRPFREVEAWRAKALAGMPDAAARFEEARQDRDLRWQVIEWQKREGERVGRILLGVALVYLAAATGLAVGIVLVLG
jgi:hypothetical protein